METVDDLRDGMVLADVVGKITVSSKIHSRIFSFVFELPLSSCNFNITILTLHQPTCCVDLRELRWGVTKNQILMVKVAVLEVVGAKTSARSSLAPATGFLLEVVPPPPPGRTLIMVRSAVVDFGDNSPRVDTLSQRQQK